MPGSRKVDPRSLGLSAEDLRNLGYRVGSSDDEPVADPADGPRRGGPGPGPRPSADSAPRRSADPRRRLGIFTLLALVGVAWGASPERVVPAPSPATAPPTEFSSARAMALLFEIAQRPRPLGSPQHDRVRAHLVRRLSELGLEPEIQTAVVVEEAGESSPIRSATVRNVVAKIPGSASTGAIVLVAPYDGAPLSPEATGGALAAVTAYEAARALSAGPQLRNDVVVAFVDGASVGSLGLRALLDEHPWASEVEAVLHLEGLGAGGPLATVEVGEGGDRFAAAFAQSSGRAGPNSLGRALLAPTSRRSGADSSGPAGLRFVTLGNPSSRGQSWDTPDRVDERTVQHAGEHALEMARALGMSDLRAPSSTEQVYSTLPFLGTVTYEARWILPATLVLLAVAALVGGVLIRLRGADRWGLLTGLLGGVLAVVTCAWLSGLLLDVVSSRHSEFGSVDGMVHRGRPHVLALVAMTAAVIGAMHLIVRRWFRLDEVAFGALLVPLGLCVWLTASSPFSAAALQPPLGLALLSVGLLAAVGPARHGAVWVWSLLVVTSAAILVLAQPSLELVTAAWTLDQAGRLGALFAVTLLLLVPITEWILQPRGWWLPPLGLGIATALVVAAMPSGRGGPEHPMPTSLVYLTHEPIRPALAIPATVELEAGPPDAERRMSGWWLIPPGPNDGWARSWVVEAHVGPSDPGLLLIDAEDAYRIAGAGPPAVLAPPVARVVEHAVRGVRRVARVAIRSGLGGEMIGVHVPEGEDAQLVAVGGVALPALRQRQTLVHWGRPEPEELLVDVSVGAADEHLDLVLIEHHLRPPEILGPRFFERPDSLAPNAALDSDRLIQRTSIRLPLDVQPLAIASVDGAEPRGAEATN